MSSTDPSSWVEVNFPRLQAHNSYEVVSPFDEDYNCVAFAAGDVEQWWQPRVGAGRGRYWPPGVPDEMTLSAFIAAFRMLGYELCSSGSPERGMEKIAFYTKDGIPKHAARQVLGGSAWLSKLGKGCDIRHSDVNGVGGRHYGEVACFMRRQIPLEAVVQSGSSD